MTRYAILESQTGYVWGVIDAADPVTACAELDADVGGRDGLVYTEAHESELRTTRSVYDVRVAPAGYDVADGQSRDEIRAVQAMPRAAVVAWQAAE